MSTCPEGMFKSRCASVQKQYVCAVQEEYIALDALQDRGFSHLLSASPNITG